MRITVHLFVALAILSSTGMYAQQGQALNFSSSSNTVVSLSSNIQLLESFTIETWIYPVSKSDFSTIIGNKSPGIASPGYFLAINNYGTSDGRIIFETQNATIGSATSVTWDQWQHIAITWDGSSGAIYINGLLQPLNSSSVNLQASPSPCYIGDIPAYIGNANYNGSLDEMRIWNFAKTQAQLQAGMFCQLSQVQPGLLVYYQFNEGIANDSNEGITTLPDLSPGNNAGTLSNFALTGSGSNWIAPGGVTNITHAQSIHSCAGSSVEIGNNSYTSDGIYIDTLTAANGCDSLLTTTITFNPSKAVAQEVILCPGENIIVGDSVYNTSGVFTNVLVNHNGCDSIVTTIVAVNSPDTTVTALGDTLIAAPGASEYQWIDCVSGLPVEGATNASFAPAQEGTFSVQVTLGTCVALSSCYTVLLTGVNDVLSDRVHLFPNPAEDFIMVEHLVPGTMYQITTIQGVLVLEGKLMNEMERVDISYLKPGLYSIRIGDRHYMKLVKI